MKVIVYNNSDGRVSVVRPTNEWRSKFETEDDAMAACVAKDVPDDAVSTFIIDESDLPEYDSATRNNWRLDGTNVIVAGS